MGTFSNKIVAEFTPPKTWMLEDELAFETNKLNDGDIETLEEIGANVKDTGKGTGIVTCRKGMKTDLASVPRICWAFIAPWDVARAAIIHDLLYKRIRQYRGAGGKDKKIITEAKKASDDVFHMAMKDANPPVAKWKIAAAYYSVRMFGRWSIIPRDGD